MKMKNNNFLLPIFLIAALVLTGLNPLFQQQADAAAPKSIIYPVIGPSRFVNDFEAPRYLPHRGHFKHHATDIIASKGQSLVAAVSGTVIDVQYPQPRWGYSVTIQDKNGYTYCYIHMNDDRPGTNNGKGGPMNAYAPDVKVGNKVVAGQLLGRVGDSGWSNGIPHLHFEIYSSKGKAVNPYPLLKKAKRLSRPVAGPIQPGELLPYGYFRGGANIDMGNFDGDAKSELVIGVANDGAPHVKLFDDNTKTLIKDFFAYSKSFKRGIDVAAGDIDGDGIDEIVTSVGAGGSPQVRVFKSNGNLIKSFLAYEETVKNGLHVAAGDIDGDGIDEIVTGLKRGSTPNVRVFKFTGQAEPEMVLNFDAYSSKFRGGTDVAVGNVSHDNKEEIITGAGPGGGPHVRTFNQYGEGLNSFYAYDGKSRTGVRVSAGNVRLNTLHSEILTIPASNGSPDAKMFKSNGTVIKKRMFIEQWWVGSYDIAAGYDASMASAGGNRRTTVRLGIE